MPSYAAAPPGSKGLDTLGSGVMTACYATRRRLSSPLPARRLERLPAVGDVLLEVLEDRVVVLEGTLLELPLLRVLAPLAQVLAELAVPAAAPETARLDRGHALAERIALLA